jgi:ATP-dependent RNA helicase DDX42
MLTKTEEEVIEMRDKLELSIDGDDIPPPMLRFEHAGFDAALMLEIYRQGYQIPTPIQAQAIPLALSGRNIIGLAKTGQGKTLAFIWSMIVHVISQPKSNTLSGPIGLILAPTRELVEQIYHEANKYSKIYDLYICPIYGGAGKYEMTKALKNDPQIVIATPGRLIEMVKIKSTSLSRCSMVVLDEADRMFEMGFESQMTCILDNIRGDRQVLLFSATMRKKVEDFVRRTILNPSSSAADLGHAYSGSEKGLVRIAVGKIGQANADIQQLTIVIKSDEERWLWLSRNIDEFISSGKVLIFVSGKQDSEDLSKALNEYFSQRQLAAKVAYLHGDVDQTERSLIVKRFSKQSESLMTEISVLVATDVASRGLDIKNIHTVINYSVPKNIDTYIHRIGRTGRLGISGVKPGTAYTILLASKDSSFAVDLVQVFGSSGQLIAPDLQLLAESDSKWSKVKYGGGQQSSKFSGGASAGLGITNKRAMTSEMLANETRTSSSQHAAIRTGNSGKQTSNRASEQTAFPTPAPLKGFVRSSQQLHSVQPTIPDSQAAQPTQRKRSRWDT